MQNRFKFLLFSCVLAWSAGCGAENAAPRPASSAPAVAAAADLKFVLPQIALAFERASGRQVRLSFGASGVFARQILQGAPYELFFSADESYVDLLQRAHRTKDAGKLYAQGRLVLFIPNGSPVHADRNLGDLAAAARDGRLQRLAIANPDHAPYGRAAREVLQHSGVWKDVESRLVLGENAAQAAQFATSGSAQAGIIPLALARAPEFAGRGAFATLPENWHAPLRQRMALIQGAGDTAQQFYAFMQTPAVLAMLASHGFEAP